jgi:DICT domain-containing protein
LSVLNFDVADLTISEVAERTGIAASTLRMWEARYGFPEPRRPSGSHRRYSDEECRVLLEIKAARERGLGMSAAIAAGREAVRAAQDSLLNGLRLRHPELPVLALPEPFMLALSTALEATAGVHPCGVLVGAFQRLPAQHIAEPVWREMAATARAAMLFAGFPACERADGLWKITVRAGTPLAEEWAVVCDTPTWWGCLVGRELQTRGPQPRGQRTFEAVWSLDPPVVRNAARVAAVLATVQAPALGDVVSEHLRYPPDVPPSALGEASHFTTRVLERLLRAAVSAARGG